VNGITGAISWCPNGSLLASPQIIRKKMQISFFESNGLRHGEIVLRNVEPAKHAVPSLGWNNESDLMVVILDGDSSGSVVQVWYRENYYWYLKYQINARVSVLSADWDKELPYRLHLLSTTSISSYDFSWYTAVSSGLTCTCAVIDGCSLQLTPLATMVMPPPMSLHTLSLPHPVTYVSQPYSGGKIF
jgi:elongator complex protein 1